MFGYNFMEFDLLKATTLGGRNSSGKVKINLDRVVQVREFSDGLSKHLEFQMDTSDIIKVEGTFEDLDKKFQSDLDDAVLAAEEDIFGLTDQF